MGTILRRHGSLGATVTGPTAVTIGNFDGLHLGHRSLISEVVREKTALGADALSVIVSFYPHPGEVLGKAAHLPRITSLHQKLAILSDWGVDLLYLVHFTAAFSKVSAKQFVDDLLISKLNVSTLVIGPDARVGHKKEGTPEFLVRELDRHRKRCRIVSFVDSEGSAVSSRRIRSLIEDGNVEQASLLLARPFAYRSRVVEGDQRGRTLGYPTANLLPNEQVVPRNGIYAARVRVGNTHYSAAVSVGVRPTFNGQGVKIEAYLLDYPGGDLYGKTIEVAFIARIRDELTFSNAAELKSEIERDVVKVRNILGKRAG